MRKSIYKTLLLIGLCSSSMVGYAETIKFSMIGKESFAAATNQNMIQTAIKAIAAENIDISENGTYLNAKVQLLHQTHPYLIVYLFNKHNFAVRTVRINLDAQYKMVYPLDLNYQLTPQDADQTFGKTKCPDRKVDFVIAAPVYELLGDFLKDVVNAEYKTAQSQGYKVVTLFGNKATVQNYKNWLSCPNLKAFASIGHGNSNYLMLSDGILFYDFFQDTARLNKNTMVTFNSCEVFNNPMEDAVIKSAQAQQFYGGRNSISVVGSTRTYGCMWDGILKGDSIKQAFVTCVMQHDPYVEGSTSPIYIDNFTKRTLVVKTNFREFQVSTKQLIGTMALAPDESLKSISILETGTACTPVDTTVGLHAAELYVEKKGEGCMITTKKFDPKSGDEDLYGIEGLGEEYLRR